MSFPLRLQNGILLKSDEAEGVLSLIRIMAATPHGSWSGSPNFGLRDLMNGSGSLPEKMQQITQELNSALSALELHTWRVETITCESGDPGMQQWSISLASNTEGAKTYSLGSRAKTE